jgi:hypothetical protein
VFRVNESGVNPLDAEIGIPVMAGETGEAQIPMGIAVYKRPRDGAVFAMVGRLLIMMNSSAKTFQFYRWDELEGRW